MNRRTRITRPEWVDYTSAEIRAGWHDGRRTLGARPWHGRRYGGLRYAAGHGEPGRQAWPW